MAHCGNFDGDNEEEVRGGENNGGMAMKRD